MLMRKLLLICMATVGVFPGLARAADAYPNKTVRLIVAYPPGGIYDVLGRMIGEKLTAAFGRQVIIDNRGGAGGVIGTDLAAKAAPDGHTIILGGVAIFAIAPSLYTKLPFDPARDFAPIALVGSAKHLLALHPSVPAHSIKQLVTLARARPGQLTFGSGGNGALTHLAGELFNALARVKMVHIPYKGAAGSIPALLSGEIDMLFESVLIMQPHVKVGKLRALAVTSKERSPVMPDLPTMIEAGVPGYDVSNWFAMYAPAATPPQIVERLNTELSRILRDAEMQARLSAQGAEPRTSTPEDLAAFTRAEAAKWAAAVRASGAKVD